MARSSRQRRRTASGRDRMGAGRRRRRTPRRDTPRGRYYEPFRPDPHMARHGVRSRLFLASLSGLTTLICTIAVLFSLQAPFTLAALSVMAFCAFNATIALVMSARREEAVHQLANEDGPRALLEDNGVDGTIG